MWKIVTQPLNRFFNASRPEQVSLILTLIWLVSAIRFNNPQFEQVVLLISLLIDLAARVFPRLLGRLSEQKSWIWLILKFVLAVAWLLNPNSTFFSPLIAILVTASGLKDFADNTPPPEKPQDYDSTLASLSRDVRDRWVNEYYKKTLLNGHENLFIPPTWRYAQADVEPSIDLPHLSADSTTVPIIEALKPAGTGGAGLLILSEGGAGKTVSVLHLMDQLLTRRDTQPETPIPVYFRLAAWASDRKILERLTKDGSAGQDAETGEFYRWLVYRLNKEYRVPVTQCAYLLSRGDVMLMLDGLDEMQPEDTHDCIDAINAFLGQPSRPKLVVCCRVEKYRAAGEQLHLDLAITLEPLTGEQILGYVDQALANIGSKRDKETTERRGRVRWLKDELTRLLKEARKRGQTAVYDDPDDLLNVLSSPLILSSALRSDAVSIEDLQRGQHGDVTPLRRRILESYVEDALKRPIRGLPKEAQEGYDPQVAKAELSWLAQKLGSSITVYVEDMQPAWLAEPFWRLIYVLLSRLYIAIVVAFATGLLLGEPIETISVVAPVALLITVFHYGVLQRNSRRAVSAAAAPTPHKIPVVHRASWLLFLVTFVLLFAVMALWFGLTEARHVGDIQLSVNGIARASVLALFLATIFGWKSQPTTWRDDIKTIEDLDFSLIDGVRSMVTWASFIGLVFGVLAAVVANSMAPNSIPGRWLEFAATRLGLPNSLLIWGGIGFILGFVYGGAFGFIFAGFLTPNDEGKREKPGAPGLPIALSFRNAIVVALETGIAFSIVFGVILYGLTDNFDAFIKGVFVGVAIGLMAALWYGGTDTIKHYVLRAIFYLKGLPFRYLNRLDWLTKTTLILQQGRGYAFYHEEVKQIFDAQTDARFKERFNARRLPALLVITAVLLLLPALYAALNQATYRVGLPADAFEVPATAEVFSDPAHHPFAAGDTVVVRSRGVVRVGTLSGYASTEGSGIGFAGIPVYGIYNVDPRLPNGVLMCRLSGEANWRDCGARSPALIYQLPFTWRETAFTAPQAGTLEFTVNDKDREDNAGAFQVEVSVGNQTPAS